MSVRAWKKLFFGNNKLEERLELLELKVDQLSKEVGRIEKDLIVIDNKIRELEELKKKWLRRRKK